MELASIRAALAPAVERLGFELYDLELVRERKTLVLRVTIDRPEGVAIDDCVAVNDVVSPLLDELDPIAGEYSLEISSAGAEKKLRNAAEIRAAIGRFVHVEADGTKTEGTLLAVDDTGITLKVGTRTAVIPMTSVTLIRQAVKF